MLTLFCYLRLPIPKLQDTAARYMKSVEALEGNPCITKETIENTRKVVNDFLNGSGPTDGPGTEPITSLCGTNYILCTLV